MLCNRRHKWMRQRKKFFEVFLRPADVSLCIIPNLCSETRGCLKTGQQYDAIHVGRTSFDSVRPALTGRYDRCVR